MDNSDLETLVEDTDSYIVHGFLSKNDDFESREKDQRYIFYWRDGTEDNEGFMVAYDVDTNEFDTQTYPEIVGGEGVMEGWMERRASDLPANPEAHLVTSFEGSPEIVERYRDTVEPQLKDPWTDGWGNLHGTTHSGIDVHVKGLKVGLRMPDTFEGRIPGLKLLRQMESLPSFRGTLPEDREDGVYVGIEATSLARDIEKMRDVFWSSNSRLGERDVERTFQEALKELGIDRTPYTEGDTDVVPIPGMEVLKGGERVGYVDYERRGFEPHNFFGEHAEYESVILGPLTEEGFEPVSEDMEDWYRAVMDEPAAEPSDYRFYGGPNSLPSGLQRQA